jgi:hypothetical protein
MNANLYLLLNGETAGPYTAASVKVMWESGAVSGLTMCCLENAQQWVPLRTFADDLRISPAPVRVNHQPPPRPGFVGTIVNLCNATLRAGFFVGGVTLIVLGAVSCLTFIGAIFGVPMIAFGALFVFLAR